MTSSPGIAHPGRWIKTLQIERCRESRRQRVEEAFLISVKEVKNVSYRAEHRGSVKAENCKNVGREVVARMSSGFRMWLKGKSHCLSLCAAASSSLLPPWSVMIGSCKYPQFISLFFHPERQRNDQEPLVLTVSLVVSDCRGGAKCHETMLTALLRHCDVLCDVWYSSSITGATFLWLDTRTVWLNLLHL